MGNKQELIERLSPMLKEKGYKKVKQTWHKQNSDLIIVFNIQNSSYSKEDYYINLGIIIKELMDEHDGICITNCQIQQRVPTTDTNGIILPPEILLNILNLWEQWYGNLHSLRIKAIEGKLPITSTGQAVSFLTTVAFGPTGLKNIHE